MRTIAAAATTVAFVLVASAAAGSTGGKPHLLEAARDVQLSINHETAAILALGQHPPNYARAADQMAESDANLRAVYPAALESLRTHEVPRVAFDTMSKEVGNVYLKDALANRRIKAHQAGAAITAIRAAIAFKRRWQASELGFATDDTTPLPAPCQSTKEFPVYAPGQGSTGVWNDVFVHNVPAGAKNIKVEFVDLVTGRAPAPGVFGPSLSWNVEPGQFTQKDGQPVYRVRVNVIGEGFGATDANVKRFKIVVTWDC